MKKKLTLWKLAVEIDAKKRTASKKLAVMELETDTESNTSPEPPVPPYVLRNEVGIPLIYSSSVIDGKKLQSKYEKIDKKTKEAAKAWIHIIKCQRCSLHFKIYSWSDDVGKLSCPECGAQHFHAFSFPSSKFIFELHNKP